VNKKARGKEGTDGGDPFAVVREREEKICSSSRREVEGENRSRRKGAP